MMCNTVCVCRLWGGRVAIEEIAMGLTELRSKKLI